MKLSVIVPCHNEQECLVESMRRLLPMCQQVAADDYEIIFIDDGSQDATWPIICSFVEGNPNVVGLKLSRNFGHQLAIAAGLSWTRGERILVLDADLQDPPELLPEMMRLMDQGADVVYGQRLSRSGESLFKTRTAKAFYRLLNWFSEIPIPNDAGDFRLISKRVKDALETMPERQRYVRGMIAWLGFRQVALPYHRDPRYAGASHYPLAKMLALAWDALTSFSVKPLKLAAFLAGLFFLLSLLLTGYALYSWFFLHTVQGWTSLALIVSLLGAGQFLVLGIIGEYLGRLYLEAKKRPLFVVDEIKVTAAVSPKSASERLS